MMKGPATAHTLNYNKHISAPHYQAIMMASAYREFQRY